MAKRQCAFTQEDVARALKGAAKAGLLVRLEIERDGKIVLLPATANPASDVPPPTPPDEIVL